MSAARLRLVECRAILGGQYDALRVVWDEQATDKDRRLLLAMAGKNRVSCQSLAGKAWTDLAPALRVEVKQALAKWREWSERLK